MGMAWLIDGNKLKEKAVSLLFPTKMETCGHLPNTVQAVTVSAIEGMLYREGVEVVLCKDCLHRKQQTCCNPCAGMWVGVELKDSDFCSYGERREGE